MKIFLKRFFNTGPTRFLLGVGFLLAIYAAYRQWQDFRIGSWLLFDIMWRFLSWLLGSTVVQSILGPLLLLISYSVIYWFLIHKRRYIVVAEFRVWGNLANNFPDKGVAARLRDELMRLSGEMRAIGSKKQSAQDNPGEASNTERESLEVGDVHLGDGFLSLPETHVTLQYEGISLEGMHTFVRRITGLEVVITGDLVSHQSDLVLAARTANAGPWEVVVKEDVLGNVTNATQVTGPEHWSVLVRRDSDTLGLGLQRLAFLIMTAMTNRFQPKPDRAFALLQIKARELGEYDLAFHLAKLGWQAAPDTDIAKWNFATAHHDIGVELANNEKYREAIPYFKKATELNPDFVEAYEHLGGAYQLVGEQQSADEAFKKAEENKQRLQTQAGAAKA